MSALSAAALRLLRTALHLTRLAVRQVGPLPVALAFSAIVTLIYLIRTPPPPPPRRRRPPPPPTPQGEGPRFLSRVQRVTLGTKWAEDSPGALFEKSDGAVRLRDDVVPYLRKLAQRFDTYFITEVGDDASETIITDALSQAGLFENGLLDRRKVLFCETELGRVSVARQIDPQMHVDESAQVVGGLYRFVPWVVLLSEADLALTARNVIKCASLGAFFK